MEEKTPAAWEIVEDKNNDEQALDWIMQYTTHSLVEGAHTGMGKCHHSALSPHRTRPCSSVVLPGLADFEKSAQALVLVDGLNNNSVRSAA